MRSEAAAPNGGNRGVEEGARPTDERLHAAGERAVGVYGGGVGAGPHEISVASVDTTAELEMFAADRRRVQRRRSA